MKKSLLLYLSLLLFATMGFVSCSNNEQEDTSSSIQLNDLPAQAQDFIKKYFRDEKITKIEKEDYTDVTIFTVYMADYQVMFNDQGIWQQVEANFGIEIPFGIMPEPIQQTLNERYSGFGVNEITRTGENYALVLTDNQGGNSIRLIFNQSGEILSESQDSE